MKEVTVGDSLFKSILHSMTGKYLVYAVQLISMMILARVFSPETFGLIAVIQVFAVFFALISDMGFGPALVNENKISKEMRDGIYSFTWILGFCVSIIFIFLSPIISWFYDNNIYQLLVIPVAVAIIFNTATIVPLASFNRDKKFISIARCDAIAEVFSVAFVLVFLVYFEPLWALALKPLIISVVRFFLVLFASKNTTMGMPHLGRDLFEIKKILAFSKNLFLFNFLNYFSRNLDNILVGKYLGVVSLGVYDKAYQLMRYPLLLLTFAMSPAIQPVMKELKNNIKEFERLHNRLVYYISILGFFVGILFYFLAEKIVFVLLGEQWEAVIPVIEVLSLTIPIQIVMSTSGGFFQAAGRTDLQLKNGVFSVLTNSTAIIIGVYLKDLTHLAWFLLISFTINYVQCYLIMGIYLFKNGVIKILVNLLPLLCSVLVLSYLAYFSII